MKLSQLAGACKIYGELTSFDASYHTFLDKTGGKLDFRDPVHMEALLTWLRKWGCRQFAKNYHKLASEYILGWAQRWESRLPDRVTILDRLSDKEIEEAGDAYDALSECGASKRTRKSILSKVRIGPAGAAKILFAARPELFPPWDKAIRAHFNFDGTSDSYCRYLARVREEIKQLCKEAAELGISPESIPLQVGRPRSTLPKLVDEYNWVTITLAARSKRHR